MPRGPRLDAPGVLHHVIARGIERGAIFRDDLDRTEFVSRVASLATASHFSIYAWALLTNQLHLLLRTGLVSISRSMHRLLGGYASAFNMRHHRVGYLFQGRFKSILTQEEPYLRELLRYIHLNPLRAHIVADLDALDRYEWLVEGPALPARGPAPRRSASSRGCGAARPRQDRARPERGRRRQRHDRRGGLWARSAGIPKARTPPTRPRAARWKSTAESARRAAAPGGGVQKGRFIPRRASGVVAVEGVDHQVRRIVRGVVGAAGAGRAHVQQAALRR